MQTNIQEIQRKMQNLLRTFPKVAGNIAVNYFLDSFKNEAWEGQKWQPRKRHDKTKSGKIKKAQRALLVQRGRLKRSIRIVETSLGYVKVATNVPYAQIHNEGGIIDTTQSISAHTRQAHTQNRKGKKVQVKTHTVQAHTRKVRVAIPQRKFMGNSIGLHKELEAELKKQIAKIWE